MTGQQLLELAGKCDVQRWKIFQKLRGQMVEIGYHGSWQNWEYVKRYKVLHENAFDPAGDVNIAPETGLLQWSVAAQERKSGMVRRVAEYFEQRRKDE